MASRTFAQPAVCSLLLAWLPACGSDGQHPRDTQDAAASADAANEPAQTRDGGAPGVVCDPRAPRCPAGERCIANHPDLQAAWPPPRCTPSAGATALKEGEACLSSPGRYDFCSDGLACTNFGTGEGFCVPQCEAPGEACGTADSLCALVDPSSGFMLCLPACVRDTDCAAPGWVSCIEHQGVKVCDAAMLEASP